MAFCAGCGRELTDDARFCTKCGRQTVSSGADSSALVSGVDKERSRTVKTIIALLTVLVLMGGTVFAYWVVPLIMTAPAQPSLESADTWCEEAVRNSWKWQSANKWCSDNLLSMGSGGPCKTLFAASYLQGMCLDKGLPPAICIAASCKDFAKAANAPGPVGPVGPTGPGENM